jgi:hypothetical protein
LSEQRGDPAAPATAPGADAPPDAYAAEEHATGGHGGEPLGPIDTTAWAAGIVGVLLGLAVVVAMIR